MNNCDLHVFCLPCNRKHKICESCRNKCKNTNTLNISCCDNCHLDPSDKLIRHNWKNQYLFSRNYKSINYTSWLKSHIINLLLVVKYNSEEKTSKVPYLPFELWIYIFKNLNLNYFSRFLIKYHNKNYCDLCISLRKYKIYHIDNNIKDIENILENYYGYEMGEKINFIFKTYSYIY